jgi:NAD(P)-dependent dehydrogenase (short-subunit alcohol dehydrogenase family)
MKDFKGKVAFITGGGSGVALGQAKVLAAAGMRVVTPKHVLAALPDPKDDPGMAIRVAAMQPRRAERATEAQRR